MHHEQFIRYCTVLTNCTIATEDLVQDVLTDVYAKFHTIKDTSKFLHYLIRVAKFKYLNGLRRKKFTSYDSEIFNSTLLDKGANIEHIYDIEVLYKALNKLPIKQKEAIILFEINGFSMKEIAEIQKSSVGAIKTKISRGRQKLKTMLSSDLTRSIYHLKSILL